MQSRLKLKSLQWALKHGINFSDTNLFPTPFEYDAIAYDKARLLPILQRIDLSRYRIGSYREIIIPKGHTSYRMSMQLDPIDFLFYTGMIYEAGREIERHRIPKQANVACAYRFSPNSHGAFFAKGAGWDSFQKRSDKLSSKRSVRFVAVTDITNFYGQLSHHRINNALETAGVGRARARHFEKILGQLSEGQSRGIPVGPAASSLLAECAIRDVDTFLRSEKYPHTRYVDDIRIFVKSRQEAFRALEKLTKYINNPHGLSLNASKTMVLTTVEFKRRFLKDPAQHEQDRLMARMKILLEKRLGNLLYNPDVDDEILRRMAPAKEVRKNLKALLKICLKTQQPPLNLCRYILRRGTRFKTSVMVDMVLEHLDQLTPILRDVCIYLAKNVQRKHVAHFRVTIRKAIKKGDYGFLTFLHLWLFWLYEKRPDIWSPSLSSELYRAAEPDISGRARALDASRNQDIPWVRSKRTSYRGLEEWRRRALLLSSKVLSMDERKAWLRFGRTYKDDLEDAVSRFALSKP